MEAELELLTTEEERLVETFHGLKATLAQVSSEGGRKLEEIRRLTKKLEELKNGKKKDKPIILKEADASPEKVTVTVGKVDRKEAVLIFPKEVWTMIFENVSDPKVKWNLTNTCHLFDNLLSSWKTGWMLGQTLPYIYKDLQEKPEKLRECREVCKSWNRAVQDFLENHPSIRPHNSQTINPRQLDFVNPIREIRIWDVIHFSMEETPIYEYPPIPKMPGTSPLTGRSIILNLHELKRDVRGENVVDEDVKMLLDKLSNFLTSFGSELWYLDLRLPYDFRADGNHHPRIVQFLCVDMIPMLPNLRELCMDSIGQLAPPALTPGSLPSLPKLETLHVYSDYLDSDPLSEVQMDKYHSQLRKFCIHSRFEPFSTFCRLEWPNLTELQLGLIDELITVERLCEVGMPQLSKLVLNMEPFVDGAGFDNLLEHLRRLCSTTRLDTLSLQGYYPRLNVHLLDAYLQAPHSLKTLELEHNWRFCHKVPNYTFLLHHFPFVENLHLYLRTPLLGDKISLRSKEDCLDFAVEKGFQEVLEIVEVNKYAYRGEMYRSNIWELFHHLKVFSFQWDVYTRHEYEEYQEKLKLNSGSGQWHRHQCLSNFLGN